MGHIINPISYRLGYNRVWNSQWASYSNINYSYLVQKDLFIHSFLNTFFNQSFISDIGIIYSHSKIISKNSKDFEIVTFIYNVVLHDETNLIMDKILKFLVLNFNQMHNNDNLIAENKLISDLDIHKLHLTSKGKWFSLCDNYINFESNINNSKLLYEQSNSQLMSTTNNITLSNKFIKRVKVKILLERIYYFLRVYLRQYLYIKPYFIFLKVLSQVLKNHLIKISPTFKNYNFSYIHLSENAITANVISSYIAKKLQQNYSLMDILKPIFKDLKYKQNLLGYKISCSGRFTRKQRATHYWTKDGIVPFNKKSAFLDYSSRYVPLKFGVCGIKVWLAKSL